MLGVDNVKVFLLYVFSSGSNFTLQLLSFGLHLLLDFVHRYKLLELLGVLFLHLLVHVVGAEVAHRINIMCGIISAITNKNNDQPTDWAIKVCSLRFK